MTWALGRAVVAGASVLVLACGGEPPAAPDARPPVRVLVVAGPADVKLPSLPGRAEAVQEVDLNFRVGGRMLERKVELGDHVVSGQVLAQLDLRDFKAELDRARALRQQTTALLGREREAATTGAVSQQELSEAEARAESARARVEIQQKALDDATLRAPFDGAVTATYVEPLQQVKEGQPVLRLLDLSKIEMWVDVPEDRIHLVRAGRAVAVRFDALPDREYTARVSEIGNEADDQTRTYPVNLLIEQPADAAPDARILPGMAGEATPTPRADAPSLGSEVPLSAVFSDATTPSYVWIVEDGDKVKRRAVETGRLTNAGIVVQKGLAPGERIVTQGGQFLRDGVEVHVVEPEGRAS